MLQISSTLEVVLSYSKRELNYIFMLQLGKDGRNLKAGSILESQQASAIEGIIEVQCSGIQRMPLRNAYGTTYCTIEHP